VLEGFARCGYTRSRTCAAPGVASEKCCETRRESERETGDSHSKVHPPTFQTLSRNTKIMSLPPSPLQRLAPTLLNFSPLRFCDLALGARRLGCCIPLRLRTFSCSASQRINHRKQAWVSLTSGPPRLSATARASAAGKQPPGIPAEERSRGLRGCFCVWRNRIPGRRLPLRVVQGGCAVTRRHTQLCLGVTDQDRCPAARLAWGSSRRDYISGSHGVGFGFC
jgi:hypothetical protein